MDLGKLLSALDGNALLLAIGIGLVLSWVAGHVDLKAILSKYWPKPSQPSLASPAKVAKGRLDLVLAKVEELTSTRQWMQQTEESLRQEIASVRACADEMEAKLNRQSATEESPS